MGSWHLSTVLGSVKSVHVADLSTTHHSVLTYSAPSQNAGPGMLRLGYPSLAERPANTFRTEEKSGILRSFEHSEVVERSVRLFPEP